MRGAIPRGREPLLTLLARAPVVEGVATLESWHTYTFDSGEATASRCFTFCLLKTALILFSALSFLGYGSACFFSTYIKEEFIRYRLGSQCLFVGILQWCAGIGLLAGMIQPWMGQAAAGGLALMMMVAVVVRIRIKDTVMQTLPALFYLLLNTYLCLAAF